MQTLEIKVPEEKAPLIKALLKELGITVKTKKQKEPNKETIAAMKELKEGKGKQFENVEELFNSI
ncbi:hypothetical protein [Sphingobacterium chuzhouense]|uniref:Addiction module antitoxin, RelB/DinJ family n=1 Tax=Sphingobacterium chuzhouense TaxID=1742264 RepID=A0ABR7XTD6_9SPHI|nr:hypothetical protein [Sphingobacterium chuzhouense]MBD1421774.1 hypothetical protein [Sphingobacterium chuzhouense]